MKLKSKFGYNRLKPALDLVSECKGDRILDIGCGGGILEQIFSDRELIGIDISLQALNNAKKNAPSAKYVLADIKSLPIKDKSVDTVAMIAVLGGIPQNEESIVFSEARRVLKDAGYLIILVSQQRQPYSLLVPDRLFGEWKWRHFNAESLHGEIEENGFSIDRVLFMGGILCLCMSLFNAFWSRLWGGITRKVIGRTFIPPLPYSLMNKIEGLEFTPFSGKLQTFARYFYMAARKT